VELNNNKSKYHKPSIASRNSTSGYRIWDLGFRKKNIDSVLSVFSVVRKTYGMD
jgi:hypothetical protein